MSKFRKEEPTPQINIFEREYEDGNLERTEIVLKIGKDKLPRDLKLLARYLLPIRVNPSRPYSNFRKAVSKLGTYSLYFNPEGKKEPNLYFTEKGVGTEGRKTVRLSLNKLQMEDSINHNQVSRLRNYADSTTAFITTEKIESKEHKH